MVYKYFRSKYVCIIVGNSVKSVIYYRRTGILRTKYRITMGVGCKICSASYSIDGDIYYTFYRISCYHAYRFRPETSPGRNQVFQKGVQVLYFPPPLPCYPYQYPPPYFPTSTKFAICIQDRKTLPFRWSSTIFISIISVILNRPWNYIKTKSNLIRRKERFGGKRTQKGALHFFFGWRGDFFYFFPPLVSCHTHHPSRYIHINKHITCRHLRLQTDTHITHTTWTQAIQPFIDHEGADKQANRTYRRQPRTGKQTVLIKP